MRTIAAGLDVLRRTPLALAPLALEGLGAAVLVLVGAFPDGAPGAAAGAAFPLGLFFDLKQTITSAPSWAAALAALGLSVFVRGGSLAATVWLSEDRPAPFAIAWTRGVRLAVRAVLLLLPAAALMFIGVATRYAPFVWIAAAVGVFPAIVLARRAVRMDVGTGSPRGRGVPEAPAWIAYAYAIAAFGSAMSLLAREYAAAAAALLLFLGPLHALVFLGWRAHARAETYPGGGRIVVTVTALAIVAFFGATVYDRYVRNPAPVGRARAEGSLLLLGGADSTSETGALVDLDPRDVGFSRDNSDLLSYRRAGKPYARTDTRADLNDIARVISKQIDDAERPRLLLGHSQASLILDRLVEQGLTTPDRAAVFSSTPAVPPSVDIPAPGRDGRGRVGGDMARAFARAMDLVGLNPFDVDAPASPTNLDTVVARAGFPRLAVWPLGDSVWLEGDWRRRGERNVVALTDHVGVVNNGRALAAARDFLAGRRVEEDSASWRGVLVTAVRYAFEPWRPE